MPAKKQKKEDQEVKDYAEWLLYDMDDDGIRCDVCYTYDQPEDDAVVICEGCDVAVHQTCYGVKEVPEGDWFCRYCEAQRKNAETAGERKCVFCPRKSGALLPFLDELQATGIKERSSFRRSGGGAAEGEETLWIHSSCANWCPEVFTTGMEKASLACPIQKERFEAECGICRWHSGVVLQCAQEKCFSTFHPNCARMVGFGMNLIGQAAEGGEFFKPFCREHKKMAYENCDDVNTPFEERALANDHRVFRLVNLARRNRTLEQEIKAAIAEKSVWGMRMSERMLSELRQNMLMINKIWKKGREEGVAELKDIELEIDPPLPEKGKDEAGGSRGDVQMES